MEDYLMEIIKRTSVFMILAQALIHFRPNPSYEKYFRFLVGIMTLVILVIPLVEWFHSGVREEYRTCMNTYTDKLQELSVQEPAFDMTPSENYLAQIGEEIRDKLEPCAQQHGYTVQKVEVLDIPEESGMDEENTCRIRIRVAPAGAEIRKVQVDEISLQKETDGSADGGNGQMLTVLFADVLGVEESMLEVKLIE